MQDAVSKPKCSTNGFGCNRCTLNLGQTIFDAPTKNSNLFRLRIFWCYTGYNLYPIWMLKNLLVLVQFPRSSQNSFNKNARSPKILEFHRISPLKNIHIPRKTLSFPPIFTPQIQAPRPQSFPQWPPAACRASPPPPPNGGCAGAPPGGPGAATRSDWWSCCWAMRSEMPLDLASRCRVVKKSINS